MNVYQLTILDKDAIHIDAINRLADKEDAVYSPPITTKDGTSWEFDFPAYDNMERFIDAIGNLRPRLF